MTTTLWTDTGGTANGPTLVLLHGLGANASVWDGMLPLVREGWPGRWMTVDLRGHGRSPHAAPYSYAHFAADVAAALDEQDGEIAVIGHSMGGAIAMALATGWFGVTVRKVLAFGVKIQWSADEVAAMKQLAQKPAKLFDDRDQAIDRYLKVSGLIGLVDPSSDQAAFGIAEENGQFRLASSASITAAVGPSVASFMQAAEAPVRLAAGDKDPMVSMDDMIPLDPDAILWPGIGHNAHVERPDLVWAAFNELGGAS